MWTEVQECKNLKHQLYVPREGKITEWKGFVIETMAEEHSRLMKADRVVNLKHTVSADNNALRLYNSEGVIVYRSEYNVKDTISLEERLKNSYNISKINLEYLIKTKNKNNVLSKCRPKNYISEKRQLKSVYIWRGHFSVSSIGNTAIQRKSAKHRRDARNAGKAAK